MPGDRRAVSLDRLVQTVTGRAASAPIVVGISGFGGSGKSTLARELEQRIPGAVRLRGDDFLNPRRSHRRSVDWDGVDRRRLVAEVLDPFREGRSGSFRRWDWHAGALAPAEPIPEADVLVVDLIGLFHPEALVHLDVTVWCDLDLATAQRRGMRRDAELGRDHTTLWNDIWVPNERDFAERFAPREAAEFCYPTGS